MLSIRESRDRLVEFFRRDLWAREPAGWRRHVFHALRFVIMVLRGFTSDYCFLRATALAYTTIFAVVPIAAVSFTMLGGFAPLRQYETKIMDFVIDQLLPPGGERSEQDQRLRDDMAARIKTFIQQKQTALRESSATIGVVGLGIVLLSAVTLLASVERSFNAIWGIPKGRPLLSRIVYYFSAFVAIPVFVGISLGLAATVSGSQLVESVRGIPIISSIMEHPATLFLIGVGTPLMLMWIAFTALYLFLPKAKVHLLSAVIGGASAAVLFEAVKWASFTFSTSFLRYSVLYGVLAAIPIMLTWIYTIWLIVLLGSEVAFAHQNIKTYSRERRVPAASQATRETIALRMLTLLSWRFYHGKEPLSNSALSDWFDVPVRMVNDLCHRMAQANILTPVEQNEELRFLPARAVETITVKHVIDCLRRGEDEELRGEIRAEDKVAIGVFNRGEIAADEVYASTDFRKLVQLVDEQA